MGRTRRLICLLLGVLAIPLTAAEASGPATNAAAPRARIDPDYTDLVIPPNIAPLNFTILEPPGPCRVRLRGPSGAAVEVESRAQRVQIPVHPWRMLLEANRGQSLQIELYRRDPRGNWRLHDTFTNEVAREEIDGWLVYRLIRPLYNQYVEVGIHQRNLSTFDERVVLRNQSFDRGCVNCHSFLNHQPETMTLHIRTRSKGLPMLLARPGGGVTRVEKTAGYLSWHPSGRWLAFSLNKLSMLFHSTGESRDVYDTNSDLGLYDLEANTITIPAPLAQPDQMETWPAWSADGRGLYFCSALKQPVERFREIRYDLKRIAFDPATGAWGQVETVIDAQALGKSIAQPRPSPDGRLLVFCLFDYGHFPIYQPNSDLQVMDLTTGRNTYRRLEINSPQADTWHCWSSNSRWMVFSSKRRDGLFARPHFTYVGADGRFHKPFVLPQEDPAFYDAFLKTFNVPELIRGPIPYSEQDFATAINAPLRVLRPKTSEAQPGEVSEGVQPEAYAQPGSFRPPE
jgi:hypothetical protein